MLISARLSLNLLDGKEVRRRGLLCNLCHIIYLMQKGRHKGGFFEKLPFMHSPFLRKAFKLLLYCTVNTKVICPKGILKAQPTAPLKKFCAF